MSFSLEVEVVWGRKMSANMSLLLLNRYMMLFAYIPTSVLLFNRPGNFGIELVSLKALHQLSHLINGLPKGCVTFPPLF